MRVSKYRMVLSFDNGTKEEVEFTGFNDEDEASKILAEFHKQYFNKNVTSWCLSGIMVYNSKLQNTRLYHIGYAEVEDEAVEQWEKDNKE